MKFRIGDLVRGVTDKYGFTNKDMTIGEVIDVQESLNQIRVKIIKHKTTAFVEGEAFTVLPEDFELINKHKEQDYTEPSRSEFELLFA